jgi:fucose permease
VVSQAPREQLYALACGTMFVFGVVLSLPGTVLGLPEVAAQLHLSLADRGTLISTLFVGLLVGSFASGPLVDALGQRTSLILCVGLAGIGFPVFGLSTTMGAAALSLGAIGLVSAGVNTAANALSSELFPAERGRRMNGIAVMVGLGGLTMPLVTGLAAGSLSWRAVVTAAGVLALALAGFGLTTARPPRSAPGGSPFGAMGAFLRQRHFGTFCLLLLLGGANEASVAGWTSTYLGSVGFDASRATLILALHWLGLVVGRLAFSSRVDRGKQAAVVRGSLGVAAGIVLLASTGHPLVLAATPFVVGMALSIVMPTMLAMAGERFAGNPGTLFGLLLTLAQVGGMLVPALVGRVANAAGVRTGLLVIAMSALAVAGITRTLGAPSAPPRA